jgi:hypothetical protein
MRDHCLRKSNIIMKNNNHLLITFAALCLGVSSSFGGPFKEIFPIFKPQIFFAGTVSTSVDKFNTSFSEDEKTIYYTATLRPHGLTGIAKQEWKDGKFSKPEFLDFVEPNVPFTDVQISPDGKKLLCSTFKDYEGKKEGFHFDIWACDQTEQGWSAPEPLDSMVNSAGNEFYPVLVESGSLYFNSDKGGNSDIYVATKTEDGFSEPVRLPDTVNSEFWEADAYIHHDESFMVFVRVDADDGLGNSDLYISFRDEAGNWSEAVHMGPDINTPGIYGSPHVSDDGSILLFTSDRKDDSIKESALERYSDFYAAVNSHHNGSLNTFYVKLDLEAFKK